MIIDRTKHPQYSYEGIEIPSSCIKEKRDDQNIDSSYSGYFCDILIWGRIRPERKYYVTKIICFFQERNRFVNCCDPGASFYVLGQTGYGLFYLYRFQDSRAPLLFDGNCSWFEGCWCF